MSCNQKKNPGAPAASPVGQPLEGGNPNMWNLGGGNFYSHNVNVLDTPQPSGGRKRKNVKRTRKNKKSKRRNIKHKKRTNKRKKMHKKKTHKRKHKTNKRRRHSRGRKHKKRTRRHRMKGGGRGPPLLMPQSLVNGGRGMVAGAMGLIDGWNGRQGPASPYPTRGQFAGENARIIPAKIVDVRSVYNAAAQTAGSI